MLYPVIPETSLKALSIFDINEKDIDFESILNNRFLAVNTKLIKTGILFNKIKND